MKQKELKSLIHTKLDAAFKERTQDTMRDYLIRIIEDESRKAVDKWMKSTEVKNTLDEVIKEHIRYYESYSIKYDFEQKIENAIRVNAKQIADEAVKVESARVAVAAKAAAKQAINDQIESYLDNAIEDLDVATGQNS